MTDRGLPIVDGAPACPFVAFEDDRDGRGFAPDHRHRCFAEPRPAPRALAHQEAYCLSSAFPVCPTFQDWARREAATARAEAAASAAAAAAAQREDSPVSQSLPPRDREERHSSSTDTPSPIPPRRNPPRDWAAPPPWSAEDGEPGPDDELDAEYGSASGYAPAPGYDPAPGYGEEPGYAPAHRYDPVPAYGSGDDHRYEGHDDPYAAPEPEPEPEPADPPPFLAPRSPDRTADPSYGAASRGLAGSAADRLAGPYADEPPREPQARPSTQAPDQYGPSPLDPYAAPPPSRPQSSAARRPPAKGRTKQAAPSARPDTQDPSELFGPAWERPRRYEAYPSLRTRVGLPGFGRPSGLAIGAVAVVLAAVVLFFVGPMILGLGGNNGGGGSGGATPSPLVEASVTPEPTAVPEPTPKVYIVAKNDTMSKIARKFKVSVAQIMAANKQIKNPDRIKIGDEITIPVPEPDAGASAAN